MAQCMAPETSCCMSRTTTCASRLQLLRRHNNHQLHLVRPIRSATGEAGDSVATAPRVRRLIRITLGLRRYSSTPQPTQCVTLRAANEARWAPLGNNERRAWRPSTLRDPEGHSVNDRALLGHHQWAGTAHLVVQRDRPARQVFCSGGTTGRTKSPNPRHYSALEALCPEIWAIVCRVSLRDSRKLASGKNLPSERTVYKSWVAMKHEVNHPRDMRNRVLTFRVSIKYQIQCITFHNETFEISLEEHMRYQRAWASQGTELVPRKRQEQSSF